MLRKLYPIGIQTFEKIIDEDYLYIDKTEYVYRMTHSDSKFMFLSRPRRFGKSLLTSTLQCYFEGKRELFKGLAIEKMEKEWTEYPVLHFDMSGGKHMQPDALQRYLLFVLELKETEYGIVADAPDPNVRLLNLINTVHQQTGKKVVVLIDEYDAPLLDVVHEEAQLGILRDIMRNFYSPLKYCEPKLQFVFLTGITKFSQMSIFSELNNIANISMLPKYAGICGITKEEIISQMSNDLSLFAENLGLTTAEALDRLQERYDGYHFTWPSSDVFNPFSLLNALANNNLDDYWFGTGTPTYLIEMMRKFDVKASDIGEGIEADKTEFDAPTECLETITPLLYQSGYLTIKNYNKETNLYTLDIPNKEIRVGLYRSLLPRFVGGKLQGRGLTTMAKMSLLIRQDQIEEALQLLQTFLGTIPYCDNTDYEGHYQQMLYVIFSLLTNYPMDVEVHTPNGRVDIVIMTNTNLYLLELKLNKSADAAMQQINLKNYSQRFAQSGLPITKVGINFDSYARIITDWIIER